MVFTPWPISGFFAVMVTMPSGARRIYAFSVAGPALSEAANPYAGSAARSSSPPPAARLIFRKARRGVMAFMARLPLLA